MVRVNDFFVPDTKNSRQQSWSEQARDGGEFHLLERESRSTPIKPTPSRSREPAFSAHEGRLPPLGFDRAFLRTFVQLEESSTQNPFYSTGGHARMDVLVARRHRYQVEVLHSADLPAWASSAEHSTKRAGKPGQRRLRRRRRTKEQPIPARYARRGIAGGRRPPRINS